MISLPSDPDSSLVLYALRFADDDAQAPRLDERSAMVSVGRDWMRINLPECWACYCASRILGRVLAITWRDWNRACEDVKARWAYEVVARRAYEVNEVVATALVRRVYEFIARASASPSPTAADKVLY